MEGAWRGPRQVWVWGRAGLNEGRKGVDVGLGATGPWCKTLGVWGRQGTVTQSPSKPAQGTAAIAPSPTRGAPLSATGKPTTTGSKMP